MCYQKALTKELETVQKYMQRQLLEPDSYTPYYVNSHNSKPRTSLRLAGRCTTFKKNRKWEEYQ